MLFLTEFNRALGSGMFFAAVAQEVELPLIQGMVVRFLCFYKSLFSNGECH